MYAYKNAIGTNCLIMLARAWGDLASNIVMNLVSLCWNPLSIPLPSNTS